MGRHLQTRSQDVKPSQNKKVIQECLAALKTHKSIPQNIALNVIRQSSPNPPT